MHPSLATRARLLLASAVAAFAVLATAPTAFGHARIPDPPKNAKAAAGKRVAPARPARTLGGTREIVALGYDSYSGLEIYVVKVDGQVVGIPFG